MAANKSPPELGLSKAQGISDVLGRLSIITPSFFFKISFTTPGFAFPPVAFIV